MKLRIPYTGVVNRSLMPNLIQAGGNGLGISKKTDVPDIKNGLEIQDIKNGLDIPDIKGPDIPEINKAWNPRY